MCARNTQLKSKGSHHKTTLIKITGQKSQIQEVSGEVTFEFQKNKPKKESEEIKKKKWQ